MYMRAVQLALGDGGGCLGRAVAALHVLRVHARAPAVHPTRPSPGARATSGQLRAHDGTRRLQP